MTEEEWVQADDNAIWMEIAGLTPRRARLLASSLVRGLGKWVADPVVATALEAAERFADTGKSKAALKRARDALSDARVALGDPHADPFGWAANAGIYSGLFAASMACAENAVPGTFREAVRTLREGDGLSTVGARRMLYPAYCEVVGPPTARFDAAWRTSTALQLAQAMYDSPEFSTMPILADALQDAGCESNDLLSHCRDPNSVHVRGCWVVDLVLGKS
jgi:hypothetical protein